MTRALVGPPDKLYWRPDPEETLWHCFKKRDDVGFASLCGTRQRLRSGGKQILRPPAMLRCVRCDVAEMKRRGVDEPLPTKGPRSTP